MGTVGEIEAAGGLDFCRLQNRLIPGIRLAFAKPVSRWQKSGHLLKGFGLKTL